MTEQQLQGKIIKHLEQQGFVVFKVIKANRAGISDIISLSPNGEFVAIEVKAPGKLNSVSALQQYFIDRVNDNHGHALAADSLDMVRFFLAEIGE